MEELQKEKLKDYLSGLGDLRNTSSFPIGAVIAKEADRNDVLEFFKEEKIAVFDGNAGDVLKNLRDFVMKNQTTALNMKKEPDLKFLNRLRDLSENRIESFLGGEKRLPVSNTSPSRGFVILLMNEDDYQKFVLGDIISSYCNLTK